MTQNDQPPQDSIPPLRPPAAQKAIAGGLSFAKLLIVLGAAILTVSIALSVLNAVRNNGCVGRMKCPSNLRQIGQALQLYANAYRSYPQTYYDPALVSSFKPDFTGGAITSPSSNPFLPQPRGSVGSNNVLAAMFLLVRTTDLNPEVFVCPSSSQEKDTFTNSTTTLTSKDVSNFTAAINVSYSFANPYPTSQGVGAGGRSPVNLGYQWSPNVTSDFAIAADRNDGFTAPADATKVTGVQSNSPQEQQRLANSRNHKAQEGQDVLYNDGHVEWQQTSFCGANRDCIYTAAKTAPVGDGKFGQVDPTASKDTTTADPQLDLDTVLLPKF